MKYNIYNNLWKIEYEFNSEQIAKMIINNKIRDLESIIKRKKAIMFKNSRISFSLNNSKSNIDLFSEFLIINLIDKSLINIFMIGYSKPYDLYLKPKSKDKMLFYDNQYELELIIENNLFKSIDFTEIFGKDI